MILTISNLSQYGIVKDVQPHELPASAFTDGKNVRFRDGYAERFSGHLAAFGTPTVAPYFLLPVPRPSDYYWIYGGLTKVYVVNSGGTHTNITRETTPASGTDVNYNATVDLNWTGGVLGGVPFLNNAIDPPQVWEPVSTGQRLLPMDYVTGSSTWASVVYSCRAMRTFKDYLVALDIDKNGTRYPTMVKWSHPAVAGAQPVSWDETDTTRDAGEYSISQTPGYVLDCLPLRDTNIIYKEDSVWGMQYIGGVFIFRFFQIFRDIGALSRRCAVEFQAGQHALFGSGDCVIHDGQTMRSILSQKLRSWLFNQMDPQYLARSFTALVWESKEVWFCYVPVGETLPTQAVTWNWESNAVGVRDLPSVTSLEQGQIFVTSVSDTWDGGPATTWDGGTDTWGERGYQLSQPEPLAASPGDTLLHELNNGLQFNGTDYESYVERTGLGLPPANSGSLPDISSMKFCRRVWPRIEGTNGQTVEVTLGAQNTIDGSVTWQNPIDYVIGSSARIDTRLRGRMLAYRVRTTSAVDWRLLGIDFDVDKSGHF